MPSTLKIILPFVCATAALTLLLTLWPLARDARAAGDVPDRITYQGMLTDENGAPISGTVTLQFLIYAAESGGAPLWSEPAAETSVVDGRFTAYLGTVTPLDHTIFDGPTRYLEVRVDGVPLPRQELTAVPFAHRAFAAQSALTSEVAITATYATTAAHATTAEQSVTALSATFATTATYAENAANAANAVNATNSVNSANSANAINSIDATNAVNSQTAVTSTYATTATYALNVPPTEPVAGRITVARSGGDFTSVKDALDSIGETGADIPMLVWVAPGVYTETGVLRVKSYVHLQGAGPGITVIRSTQGGSSLADTSAALEIQSHSQVSDLSVVNRNSANPIAIGIWAGTTVTRSAVIENVHLTVNGAGGSGHYALYLYDAEPTVRGSRLQAYGATSGGSAINAALASANPIPANFPQPWVEGSILIGGGDDGKSCIDSTGTGYGVHATESDLHIVGSYICGGHRGILARTDGIVQVQGSEIWASATGGAFLFESTAAAGIRVATSLVGYSGNRHTGTGSLSCIHSFKSNYAPATDHLDATQACT